MKKNIYQRLALSLMQIALIAVLLVAAGSHFPVLVYTVVPIASALILAFIAS